MGIVKAAHISEKKGMQKVSIHSAKFIENFGIRHGAHAGSWHCQVSLMFEGRIDAFKEKGAQAEGGAFGENLIVEGYDFKTLLVGTVFRCSDVVLKMIQVGKECHARRTIYKQVGDYVMPREGVFATVEHDGIISEGDEPVIVEQPEQEEDNSNNNRGT